MIWARWAGVMGVPMTWEIARIFVVGTGGSGFCAEAGPSGVTGFFCIYGTDLAQWVVTESPVAISKATTEFTRMGADRRHERGIAKVDGTPEVGRSPSFSFRKDGDGKRVPRAGSWHS